jgi:hypothetical protein
MLNRNDYIAGAVGNVALAGLNPFQQAPESAEIRAAREEQDRRFVRSEALRLATATMPGGQPADIVKAAEAFFAFLHGERS